MLEDTQRLDIEWDTYISYSLKESTRQKRGQGVRRKVSGQTKLPGNWGNFLHDPMNKKELFAFLTFNTEEFDCSPDKSLYITSEQAASSFGSSSTMSSCNHEEADTRIVVHIQGLYGARSKNCPRAYCGHWCHRDYCRFIPWFTCDSTFDWHLGGFWHRQKVQILAYCI